MKYNTLGQTQLKISTIGFGCMGMSEFYGQSNDQNSLQILQYAFQAGINFYDTADTYGHGHNEQLLGKFIAKHCTQREEMIIATKFGIVRSEQSYERRIDNHPDYIRQACDASLQHLGIEQIDLYYCHRRQHEIPIEDVTGTLADLVKHGKIKSFGFSEISAQSLQQACKIAPVTAVQSEYSLWAREPEQQLLATCQQLGTQFIAYSPLGRAFLTAKFDPTQIAQDDFRKSLPKLQGQALEQNQQLIQQFSTLCQKWGYSNAQVALAWLINKHSHVTPIFGTRHIHYLHENLQSINIQLTHDQIKVLDTLFLPDHIQGERYPDAGQIGIE